MELVCFTQSDRRSYEIQGTRGCLSADEGGGFHGDGEDLTRGQIQGEVVGVTFVHDFHTKISTVDDVGPSVDDTSFRVNDSLVKVESVQVEGHGGDTHSSAPDAEDRPQREEEVECTGVVEGCVLEDETSCEKK